MGTTPIYNLTYPDYADMVDDGATAIGTLATDIEEMIDVHAGLKKIVPTGVHTNITFNSRGNGTPTVGQTNFTIRGVFSASYNAYRLIWTGYRVTSGAGQVWAQFTDAAINTAVYAQCLITTSSGSTVVSGVASTNSEFRYAGSCIQDGTLYNVTCLDIYNPAQPVQKMMNSMYFASSGTPTLTSGQTYCYVNSTTVSTGINLACYTPFLNAIAAAGTLSIYGYNL